MAAAAVAAVTVAPVQPACSQQRGRTFLPLAYRAADGCTLAPLHRTQWPGAVTEGSMAGRARAVAAASRAADPGRAAEPKEEMRGKVLTCNALFKSPDYLFAMPAIQRPYDWDESDARLLLEDLLAALGGERKDVRSLDPFLLGPINLADGPLVDPKSDLRFKYVLDGQQRIITLCMLFAAARERFLEGKEALHAELAVIIAAILKQPGDVLEQRPAVLRVHMLRRDDTEFLEALLLQPDFQPGGLVGESQPKLWANLQLYRQLLQELDLECITALLQFILARAMVTVTESSSISTGLKYFSVSAQRGKQLGSIDVLKGCVFDSMGEEQQALYGDRWSALERLEDVGREGISRVCSLLAAIHLKQERGRRSEYDEPQMLFRELAGGYGADAGPAFFDGVLEPYTQLYLEMTSEEWRLRGGSNEQQREAAYLLTCLCRLSPKVDDWEALALAALMQHRLGRLDAGALIRLLRELERLCWSWLLGKVPKAVRRKRIAQALEELGLAGQQPEATNTTAAAAGAAAQHLVPRITSQFAPALRITNNEAATMMDALEGPLYTTLKGRPIIALLARLNEHVLLSGGLLTSYLQPYNINRNLTVEHVLPQKPPAGSDWGRQFSGEEQEYWVHRLGNLVLLHGKLNSRAGNKEFSAKREAWRPLTNYDTHSLPLSDKVFKLERWDVAAVQEKQEEAVRLAFAAWQLHDVAGPGPGPTSTQP